MVSYFKTQWYKLLCALVCLIYSIVIAYTSTPVTDSVEGVAILLGDAINFGAWFLASILWCVMSFVSYNTELIQKLNERIEALEREKKND